MPLFHICGIQPNKKSFSIAAVFINAEKEPQYIWALGVLHEYLATHELPLPKLVVTDRELALIKALKSHVVWSDVSRLLCRWHVNMNVLAKGKRFFPPAKRLPGGKIQRNERFTEYLKD
jgi:hypothetical protein